VFGRARGCNPSREGGWQFIMQETGVASMNIVSRGAPLLRGASPVKGKGREAARPVVALKPRAAELAALERAQQVHAQSMMILVHELRSPVTASKTMLAGLRYLHAQDTQLDDSLARIEGRMDQLLDLVNDILDLSQARSGRPLGQATVLDAVAETREVCEPYQEEAAAKGLAMSVELPGSRLPVFMPAKTYRLIVSNLVSNAVKYTPAGSIRVTLRKKGNWLVLKVRDTGIGVPPGEISHLFTEFFRASNARAGHKQGTGLGLAAVQALVKGNHGELQLQTREHKGTKFTVRLPLCKADAARERALTLPAGGIVQ
jgi:signal transduction histidine kinase